ncbi:flagellar hook-associated protein FlgK [Thioclava sp. A2]|uniref:flagellar hook-associated protein FlgK n=1 Tax=Thioclava sp. FCG-A2 TaxID=3080562 RepID=UPI002953D3EC|nr:flagellar hook-associated protein FlgK [Thioclava sp. A2]MDV7270636.1 flagellar hook-associated protein FlgK [Thioclava sp. A2]
MSISGSLSNALSGLAAASRMADVVASNTSNAMTEGYARRELSLASQTLGGNGAGVRILGLERITNNTVIQDLRLATSATSSAGVRADFYSRIEAVLGEPDDPSSLVAKVTAFEAALVEASSRPDSASRLEGVLRTATAITEHLTSVSDEISTLRMGADQEIQRQVDTLNGSLQQVDQLNASILAYRSSGRDATALMDQRQSIIDQISEIVPVRQQERDNLQVSLYTTGGAILLEGNPSQIGFSSVGVITPDMTQQSGALSGLTLNGMTISSSKGGVLGGGSLGALFEVRDDLATGAQSQIDAFARDLIERFQDPSVDPTLNSGDAGLFTDAGLAFSSANEVGISGRIRVSALVDPAHGGSVSKLRDGLGSTSTGDPSNATLLNAMLDSLTEARQPATGTFGGGANGSINLAADFLSQIAGNRLSAEDTASYATARQGALKELVLADGVDTDYEMQMLLKVEQMYAANARVIQTIDSLISQILEL